MSQAETIVSQAAPQLGSTELVLSAVLILFAALASVALRLGMERRIAVAALRSVVQLLLLGLVLHWVFALSAPWPVLAIALVMACIAGVEAVRRIEHRIDGIYPLAILTMTVSALAITVYATHTVLGAEPWWQPRWFLPILGMVLGNALNGISLGLDRALRGFERERDAVEAWLALGVSAREAGRDVVREAVRTGLMPILNSMVAAGLLSIPGMMTGQILAGAPALNAALYQVFILFTIAGSVALGTVSVVLGAAHLVFDRRGRLRIDRLRRPDGADS